MTPLKEAANPKESKQALREQRQRDAEMTVDQVNREYFPSGSSYVYGNLAEAFQDQRARYMNIVGAAAKPAERYSGERLMGLLTTSNK